ncbi:hypothetical protein CSB37_02270 [bacterium DOLZORAL124_38_8]|nr:MAG: hypothetical protein CSB37_02270 [bacterium DOLZORAL124_38_8]
MKFVVNSFGENTNLARNRFIFQNTEVLKQTEVSDKSPVIDESKNALTSLKNTVAEMFNCNKKKTEYKFKGERPWLKELRDLKINDTKSFQEIQTGLDKVELNTQKVLGKYGQEILESLNEAQQAEQELAETNEGFETAHDGPLENATREEKRTTRKTRRQARRNFKEKQRSLKKSIKEFQKPFQESFEEFQKFHNKNLEIQNFVNKQYEVRKELLEARIKGQELAQSLNNPKLIAKRDKAVSEAVELFEKAEISKRNANKLVRASGRILQEYQTIAEAVDFKMSAFRFKNNTKNPEYDRYKTVLEASKMVSTDENERKNNKEQADKYKEQKNFSALQVAYEEAQAELKEAQEAAFPNRPKAKERLEKAKKQLQATEQKLKDAFDTFSEQSIRKQLKLDQTVDTQKTALENSGAEFKTKLEEVIGALQDQINASQNEGVVTDSVAQEALAKAENLKTQLSNVEDLKQLKNLDETVTAIVGALNGSKKIINVSTLKKNINAYQTALDDAKTHREEVLKEAQEYGELGIEGITDNPFENTKVKTKITEEQKQKEEEEEEERAKEAKEKHEKSISTLIQEVEKALESKASKEEIDALFKANKYFVEQIRQGFEEILATKKDEENISITVEEIVNQSFTDVDITIKTKLLNIMEESGYKTRLQNNINEHLPKNNDDPNTDPENPEDPDTPEENESSLYLDAAKDTPEFKWVMKQLVEKEINLDTNDWNDIRNISKNDLKQFRTNKFNQAHLILLAKLGFNDKNDVKNWLNSTKGQNFLKSKYENLSDYFMHQVEIAKNGKGEFNEKAKKLLLNNGENLLSETQVNKLPGATFIKKLYNLNKAGVLEKGLFNLNTIEDAKINPLFISLLKLPHAGGMTIEEIRTIKTALDKNLIETIGNTTGTKFEVTEGHSRIKQKQYNTISELAKDLHDLNTNETLYFKETSDAYNKLYAQKDDPVFKTIFDKLVLNKHKTAYERKGLGISLKDWNNIKDITKDGFKSFLKADESMINEEKWEMFKHIGFSQSELRIFLRDTDLGKRFMNSKSKTLADFFVAEYEETEKCTAASWKTNEYQKESYDFLYRGASNLSHEEIVRLPVPDGKPDTPIWKVKLLEDNGMIDSDGQIMEDFRSLLALDKQFWNGQTINQDFISDYLSARQADAFDQADDTFHESTYVSARSAAIPFAIYDGIRQLYNEFSGKPTFEVDGTGYFEDEHFHNIGEFHKWLKNKKNYR